MDTGILRRILIYFQHYFFDGLSHLLSRSIYINESRPEYFERGNYFMSVTQTKSCIKVQHVVGEGMSQVNLDRTITLNDVAKKVAGVDAEIKGEEAKVIPNKVIVEGVLHKQIYYIESLTGVMKEQTVEEPFTHFVHIEGVEEGMDAVVDCMIEYCELEPLNHPPTDKWQQVCIIKCEVKVVETHEIEVVTDVMGAVATKDTFCVERVIADASRQSTLRNVFETPTGAKKIMDATTKVKDLECDVLPNKVLVKGKIYKQVYYVCATTGEVLEKSEYIPFSTFIDAPGVKPGMDCNCKVVVEYVDHDPLKRGPQGVIEWQQTIVIEAHCKVTEIEELTVVTNVLGVATKDIVIKVEDIKAKECKQVNLRDEFKLPEDAKKVYRVDAKCQDIETKVIKDKVIIEGKVHKQVYYVDADTLKLKEFSMDVPFDTFIHVPGVEPGDDARVTCRIEYTSVESVKTPPTDMWQETVVLEVCCKIAETREIKVVTDVLGVAEECIPGEIIEYTIMAGDTLFLLAKRYNTSAGAILKLNPGIDPNNLQIGTVIKIPCGGLG